MPEIPRADQEWRNDKICGYRWQGGRADVSDAIVLHVCFAEMSHDQDPETAAHVCSCGAET